MRALREGLLSGGSGFRGSVRWRGLEVSRIEALTDGVFAIAVTLLAVSTEVPTSFDDLIVAMQGFGSFAASFATLMLIWYAHYSFFREYGLNDLRIVVLNSALLLVVLFYIYPLKFLYAFLIDRLILREGLGLDVGGEIEIAYGELHVLLIVYSTGFLLVFLIFALMNLHALSKREELELTPEEVWHTRTGVQAHLLAAAVAALSIGIAAAGGPGAAPLAGWIYVPLGPLQGIHSVVMGRLGRRRFGGGVEVAAP